jgi:hypothetical protein
MKAKTMVALLRCVLKFSGLFSNVNVPFTFSFVVEKSDEIADRDTDKPRRWHDFANTTRILGENTMRIAGPNETPWLLPLDSRLLILSKLTIAADKNQVPYLAPLIEGELQWLHQPTSELKTGS